MAWAAFRVPAHDSINRRNALLLSLAGQAAEMASHLFGEVGMAMTYEQVKAECEMLFRPAYESQTLKQAFRDYRQHSQEPIQTYVNTKCALYREAYSHQDLEFLIDELTKGIRNPNVKKLMYEGEYDSLPAYTRRAMYTVTLVTKQLRDGVAWSDSTDGLAGSASVQLPQYDDSTPMEIGSMAPGLHQMGKVGAQTDQPRRKGNCFNCEGIGHHARDCPTPLPADGSRRPVQPRAPRGVRCERCTRPGHTAADCRADWEQVQRKKLGAQPPQPGRPNAKVAHMDGGAPPADQPAATTPAAAARQDDVPQFSTIPARVNMIGPAQGPTRLTGFGLNQMELSRVAADQPIEPNSLATQPVLEPRYNSEELYGIVGTDLKKPFEVREVIAHRNKTDNYSVEYYSIIGRDITLQKKAEDEAKRHQLEMAHMARLLSVGEMASGLAHEINQPLAAIINYCRGTLRRIDEGRADLETTHNAMRLITRQAKRAAEIVRRMRSFVKKTEYQRIEFPVNEACREISHFLHQEAIDHNITFDFRLDESDPNLLADKIQIEQVLLNLMRNAIEAYSDCDKRYRPVIISSRSTEGYIYIEVEDEAKGIDREALDKLFEPFYTSKANGLGMGLAISRTIIETHGGQLWAESDGETGTRFNLKLPRRDK